jgi:hypothetical protein
VISDSARVLWGRRFVTGITAVLALAAALPPAAAQPPYEQDPINYNTANADDPVARLQRRLERGEAKLQNEPQHGYLKALLRELDVPASSQTLVFSKTSFQRDRISPTTPRALYYDDNTYIGWVPGGDLIELASVDPQLGTVFYTLDQRKHTTETTVPAQPRFVRQTHACLQCHGSSMTRDVPGLLVRSIYPDVVGQPVFSAGTSLTTQERPIRERWGGWYVTGGHGRQRHMGNMVVKDEADPEGSLDTDAGANVLDLSSRFDTSPYLSGHSDIVALMVLEHQAQMHNLLTRANHQTRIALRDAAVMNESLGRPADHLSESTQTRIADAGEPVVRYMLFMDEAAIGNIEGSSTFRQEFEARGPKDSQGRSLRELDLKRRLFKHPCSYLIYSGQFDALPQQVKDYVYRRLFDILTGVNADDAFSHLSGGTRQEILEILRETKPGLPDYWK